jgi:hypothetical protein
MEREGPDQEQFYLSSAWPFRAEETSGEHLRVIENEQIARSQQFGERVDSLVSDCAGTPLDHQQPGMVARFDRLLGDQ